MGPWLIYIAAVTPYPDSHGSIILEYEALSVCVFYCLKKWNRPRRTPES